jgi:hypothetical protein
MRREAKCSSEGPLFPGMGQDGTLGMGRWWFGVDVSLGKASSACCGVNLAASPGVLRFLGVLGFFWFLGVFEFWGLDFWGSGFWGSGFLGFMSFWGSIFWELSF